MLPFSLRPLGCTLAVAFFVSRPAPAAEENATPTTAYVDNESGWLVVWAAENGGKSG